jgi:hypothetical protein
MGGADSVQLSGEHSLEEIKFVLPHIYLSNLAAARISTLGELG